MAEPSLKEKTARGLLWGGLNNGLQQVLNLAFGILLANILDKSDYGMVGMLTIFSAVAGALQEGGFISALNHRKNVSHADYNAVFWFNAGVSFSLYVLLFFCAPLIADFYDEPRLTALARFMFLGFFISSLNIVPRAYLFRELRVRETTYVSLAGLIISGVVGVAMALCGLAYWGIATQSVVFVSVMTLVSFRLTRWRPTLPVDFRPVREMFGFSSKLIVTALCNIVNANLFSVVLGKLYTANEVGIFSQANKWNYMGYSTISGMLGSVSQPVFTKVEDTSARQLAVFRKLLRFTAFFAFPAMFGLSLVSREFIVLTIGTKWLESAAVLQLLCVWGAFVPVCSLFSNYIIARGHSDIYMWCTIALSVVTLGVVGASAPWGMNAMFRCFVVVNILWLFVWHYFVRREIGLRLRDLLRDLAPYCLLAAALCLAAHVLLAGVGNLLVSLLLKVVVLGVGYCAVLWFGGSVIFRESVRFLWKRKIG